MKSKSSCEIWEAVCNPYFDTALKGSNACTIPDDKFEMHNTYLLSSARNKYLKYEKLRSAEEIVKYILARPKLLEQVPEENKYLLYKEKVSSAAYIKRKLSTWKIPYSKLKWKSSRYD